MSRQSLKQRCFLFLKNNPLKWFHKGEIMDLGRDVGYLSDNVSRRLRELCNDGKIEKKEEATKEHGKTVFYRYVPSYYENLHHSFQTSGQLKLQ